jgi:hypothetical protein
MATTTDEKAKPTQLSARTAAASARESQRVSQLDYKDLKDEWKKIIQKDRTDAESNLLRITTRISKLDPIAEAALAKVRAEFSTEENELRERISDQGWATELAAVNKHINRLRFSENKRMVLAEVYPAILADLLKRKDAAKSVKDEIGFTNDVMFELERENGPLDLFAQEIVKRVGDKHRINFTDDNVLRDLVAHQVRDGL